MASTKLAEAVPAYQPAVLKNGILERGGRVLRRYYDWKSIHQYLGRYSTEKLLSYDHYREETSPKRVFAVIVLTPVPGLLIMLLLAAIPLKNPLLGVTSNVTFFVQSALSYTVMCFSLLLFIRCSLRLPNSVCSHGQAMFISVLTAFLNELVMVMVAVYWRFPVPFRDLVGIPSFTVVFVLLHRLVLGKRLIQYYQPIVRYLPLLCAQSSTLVIFQGVAIVFQNVPGWAQAIITILFPVLRSVIKRIIWGFAFCLQDISTDVALCVVEIFGSLFQNVCIQKAQSPGVTALIILVDFTQAVFETRMYLRHNFIVDGRQATQTAVKIVESGRADNSHSSPRDERILEKLDDRDSVQGTLRGHSVMMYTANAWVRFPKNVGRNGLHRKLSKIACLSSEEDVLRLASVQALPFSAPPSPTPASTPKMSIDNIEFSHREHAKLLSQTLQLVFASEVLVFAEYSEFVCAVVYGIYTLSLYHTPYAKYNLSFIGLSEEHFWVSMTNSAVYAFFEGLTLFFLFYLARAKYGLSTFYQLSFVLEKYWMSVQGKIIGSLSLIFILNTVHHGTSAQPDRCQ
jgi:hypothetical protein